MAKIFLAGVVLVAATAAAHWHAGAAETPTPAAVDAAADGKAPPELIDALKKIASGELAADKFEFVASFMSGAAPAQYKVGDAGPNVNISIRKGAVSIVKTVVTALKPVGPASIPTFGTRQVAVEATDAEVRRVAGLMAEAGVGASVKGISWRANEQRLRADVSVDGKSGTLSVDMAKPEEAKRGEALLKLLNDFAGRTEKQGAGK